MEIEFTIVMTEVLNGNVKQEPIETIKEELIKEFGGLTVQECKGSWLDNEKMYKDINEKWQILTDKGATEERIKDYAERLRVATKQIAQLYRIEYKSFLIDAQGIVKEKELQVEKQRRKEVTLMLFEVKQELIKEITGMNPFSIEAVKKMEEREEQKKAKETQIGTEQKAENQ
jgi:hypothetical protein